MFYLDLLRFSCIIKEKMHNKIRYENMMPIKCALYLCTDASDRKMDAKFVISDPENPGYSFIRKKFLRGGATLVQECQNFDVSHNFIVMSHN